MSNRTLTMIKPDAMNKGYAGAILDMISKAGFRIVAMKQTKLSIEKAGEFYAIHKGRPFYNDLVAFMSSGPIIAAILEKENAVAGFRNLIGAPDPSKSMKETFGKLKASPLDEIALNGTETNDILKF